MSSEIQQEEKQDLADFVETLDDDQTEEVVEESTDSESDESNQTESESETANDESNEGDYESDETEADTEGTKEETEDRDVVQPSQPVLTTKQEKKLAIDDKLSALHPQIKEAENLVDSLKKESKTAKEDLEKLQRQANNLISQIYAIDHGGQQYLPLDEDDDEVPHPDVEAGKNRPHGHPVATATAMAVKQQEDPGKKTTVRDLDITEIQADALIEKSVYMVADLEKRIREANDGGYAWHDGINGISKKKATRVEDALEKWRKENPPPVVEEADEPEVKTKEPEPVEEEEPATIPINQDDIEWWCCECNETWPVDGANDQCPHCENETGNEKIGYGCPDANELGVIVRGYESVPIVDDDETKCFVRVYEAEDGHWLSSITIEDKSTPYAFSNNLQYEDFGSTSRDAAIWNELKKVISSDAPAGVSKHAEEYMSLHLSNMDVDTNKN